MTRYCLEFGSEASANAIVHELGCENFDHGTLLGEGRLANLGEFDGSRQALDAARERQPDAVRCLNCCLGDLVKNRQPQQQPAAEPADEATWSAPLFTPEAPKPRAVRPH